MSKAKSYEETTEELILPILEAKGLELYDVEYVKEGSEYYLRVYIEKEGGVTIDDCVEVSRVFNDILDEKDYISDAYTFEVSSPGLGRLLKKDRHFEKSIGEEVELKTFKPIDKQKEFAGVLKAFDKESITIVCNDEEKTFARADLASVRLALDF